MTTWSHSRLTTFEQCPKRFEYRYLERQREAFRSIEAFMGSCVHDTIELAVSPGPPVALDDMIDWYSRAWQWRWTEESDRVRVIRAGTKVRAYHDEGADMLRTFYPFLYDNHETLEIEKKVSCEIEYRQSPTSYQLFNYEGYIDRLALAFQVSPRCPIIIDYKTTKHIPRTFDGKEADQLRAYGLCLMKEDPTLEVVELRAVFVRTGETRGELMERPAMREIEQRLGRRLSSAAAPRAQFPPIAGKLCDWCGFNDRCPGPKQADELPF